MPRVTPTKLKPVKGDAVLGSTLKQMSAAEAARRDAAERGALESPYEPRGLHSYFGDRVLAAIAKAHGGVARASEERLEQQRFFHKMLEQRDLTMGDPGGQAFLPSGPPGYLGDLFATAARAQSALADALPMRPLPEFGAKIEVPRVQSGAAVAVQAAENAAVQEADLDLDLVSSQVTYIAGQNDVSRSCSSARSQGLTRSSHATWALRSGSSSTARRSTARAQVCRRAAS
jgi:hypothetical protein